MVGGELRERPVTPPQEAKIEQEGVREREPSGQERGAMDVAEARAAEAPPISAPAPKPPAPAPAKDAYLMRVERVLEENLRDVYFALEPGLRARFKAKGEETARTIRGMIESAKVKAGVVLKLITAWLRMIPKVNGYFLEQEAKIKTDKIMFLVEDRKKEKGEI